jgi:hypothetical protein
MPFSCKAEILPEQLRGEVLIFDGWIEKSWHKYVAAGTPFARAHDSKGPCTLRLAGPGYLRAKPNWNPGDRISGGSIVAFFDADGEAIPYGHPYCQVEFESS